MRKITIWIFIFVSNIFVSSCGTDDYRNGKAMKGTPFSFITQNYSKQMGDCPTPEERCLEINLEYPTVDGGDIKMVTILNNYIHRSLLNSLTVGEEEYDLKMTIDSAVIELNEEYKDLLDDSDNMEAWRISTKVEKTFLDTALIALKTISFNYSGGAHANTYFTQVVFDKKTGDRADLKSIVKDLEAVKIALESKFRAHHQIEQGTTLEGAGFWFEKNKFSLPANFGLEPDSLVFIYNPYEVAPFVVGMTELKLPLAEFRK